MKYEILLEIKDNGIDIDGAISKLCNNIELYKKLLLKFLEDENFENLINSLKIMIIKILKYMLIH